MCVSVCVCVFFFGGGGGGGVAEGGGGGTFVDMCSWRGPKELVWCPPFLFKTVNLTERQGNHLRRSVRFTV